jgi:hypothetical protein
MQATLNGTRPATITSIPTIERADIASDLDSWDDTIAALDLALRDADMARRDLEIARREMELIEARRVVAGVEGRNEGERKAHLILALVADPDYRLAELHARDAADDQRNAERQVRVLMETCRLLRASIELTAGRGG